MAFTADVAGHAPLHLLQDGEVPYGYHVGLATLGYSRDCYSPAVPLLLFLYAMGAYPYGLGILCHFIHLVLHVHHVGRRDC